MSIKNTKSLNQDPQTEAIVKIGTMLALLLALLVVLTLWLGESTPANSVQTQTPTSVVIAAQDASVPSVAQATTAMASTEQNVMPTAHDASVVNLHPMMYHHFAANVYHLM